MAQRNVVRHRGSERLVVAGLALAVCALMGWLGTIIVVAFGLSGDEIEDLTAAWIDAGPTPLGGTATVEVPSDETLVAFLVGTQLTGISGTTTGTCRAEVEGEPVDLSRRVHINRELVGVLDDGQETVAIAAWQPGDGSAGPTRVAITCDSRDSTVEHFVAVPSGTAVIESDPWFQPWGWAALGGLGVVLAVVGLARLPSITASSSDG